MCKHKIKISLLTPLTLLITTLPSSVIFAKDMNENSDVMTSSDVMTVTITGEEKSAREITATVHSVSEAEIKRINPAHPSELLNRQAGVHINDLGGEGHMTAIRQPISTSAAYLFLEDGIPTRPSGLFNHNALYEVNMPQAGRVEVIKGPGSALYGSESIGGIINSITQPSPEQFEFNFNPEIGSHGWKRALISTGNTIEDVGFRLNLNLTDNTGYRDEADYSRMASTLRLDGKPTEGTTSKTIIAYSTIEQSGVDDLDESRYLAQSTDNPFHNNVGRRDVTALRLSNEFVTTIDSNNKLTFTPFFRDNQMLLMPSWMLTYDPNDRDYEFQSYGFLTKFRQKASAEFEWILGLDLDYSPSTYKEIRLQPVIENDIYTDTTPTGRTNYDFDAAQLALSPYVHLEWRLQERLKLTLGLRYDYFKLDYTDNLDDSVAESQTGADRFTHLRPEDQKLSFEHWSPKIGTVYNLNAAQDLYATYRHSFRAPSSGTLFRSGSSTNTDELDPVKTNSVEIGTRGGWAQFSYDLAFYHMVIKDDIVDFIDQDNNDRKVTNAGETQHQGVELTLSKRFSPQWSGSLGATWTTQQYKDFTAVIGFPPQAINYAGNDVPRAPENMLSASLRYEPLAYFGSVFELELQQIGEYYTDETNTQLYDGHTIANFRASYPVNRKFNIYGRITNLEDKVYSTYTSNQVGDPDISYRPGSPRSFFIGMNYDY